MSSGNSLCFSDLPPSLIPGLSNCFAGCRLEMKILDLEHLRDCILEQGEAALCREWLHPLEQETLSSLLHQKRHIEWLGGRICAKEALRCFLKNTRPHPPEVPAPGLQIIHAPSGRPLLHPGLLNENIVIPHASISHSGKYALALAADAPCGIDIQENREPLGRIQERFCSQSEGRLLMRLLLGIEPSEHLTLLWAAKESVKKAVLMESMPGFLELVLNRIDFSHGLGHPGSFLFTFAFNANDQRESGETTLPSLQFQALVCLYHGYGVGLCISSASSFPGFHHA
jgi:4'-phosphopantetheinyl transferase EntD